MRTPRRASAVPNNSSVVLRDYRPADFNAIWELDQLCFEPKIAYPKAELRHFLRYPGAFALVAEEIAEGDGVAISKPKKNRKVAERKLKVVGFILTHAHPEHGHIITIDVHADQRRTGLGSQLLEAAEVRLRSLGKKGVVLEVAVDNLPALTFYKRHGYSVIKTIPGYYANGLDALAMAKSFTPA